MQSLLFGAEKIGDIERELAARYRYVVGLDEAGRGPLAGPVYAAAVVIDLRQLDADWLGSLNDSKQLSDAARRAARARIFDENVACAIAAQSAQRIDEINILQASLKAMEAALADVSSDLKDVIVLVDGKQEVETDLPQMALVKGDAQSYAIAAASILAKVGRDDEMITHHATWPEYGFERHKGYPSKFHREAIAEYGPCAIHRLSFAGVKEHMARLRE